VFYIGFTSAPRRDEEDWLHAVGALTLGPATEGFEADLGTWSIADYERHSYRGPEAAYHFMWPVWRVGTDAVFQERLLFAEQLTEPFVPSKVYDFVGDRVIVDEDGRRVSEWTVPLGQLANFLLDG
jgi:hypothetical protein